MAPLFTVLAQVPARHLPCDGSGHLRYASRPNPVRRDGDQNLSERTVVACRRDAWDDANLLIDDNGTLCVHSESLPEVLLQSSFCGRPGGRTDVRAARHVGPSQSGNLLRFRTRLPPTSEGLDTQVLLSAAVALWHVRDQHVTLRGPRFPCSPVWLHTPGNSAVEPLQRQSCYPLVAWGAP